MQELLVVEVIPREKEGLPFGLTTGWKSFYIRVR